MTSALSYNAKLAGSLMSLFHQFQKCCREEVGGRQTRREPGMVRGKEESQFLHTVACVHHLQERMCALKAVSLFTGYIYIYRCVEVSLMSILSALWVARGLLSICSRVSGVCYHFLCPWELPTDMPVSLGWTALVNCSLNSPALDSAFGGKSIIWPPLAFHSPFSACWGQLHPAERLLFMSFPRWPPSCCSTRSTVNAATTSTCATKERANALVTHTLATPSTPIQQLRGCTTSAQIQLQCLSTGRWSSRVQCTEWMPLTAWQP